MSALDEITRISERLVKLQYEPYRAEIEGKYQALERALDIELIKQVKIYIKNNKT